MKGLIPEPKTRSLRRPLLTSFAGGVCLLFGFVIGTQVPTSSAIETADSAKNVLSTQTIDFSKISWIADEISQKKLKLAENNSASEQEILEVKLTFSSFKMPVEPIKSSAKNKIKNKIAKKISRKKFFIKPIVPVVEVPQESFEDTKLDFQMAMAAMRSKFYATVEPKLVPTTENLADLEEYKEKTMAPVVMRNKPLRLKKSIQKVISVAPKKKLKKVLIKPDPIEMNAEITEVQYPAPPKADAAPVVITQQAEVSIQTTQSSADSNIDVVQTKKVVSKPQATEETKEGSLSQEEKDALQGALLNEQWKSIIALEQPKNEQQKIVSRPAIQKKADPSPEPTPVLVPNLLDQCPDLLTNHKFLRPGSTEDSQICPERKTWISKERVGISTEQGWVKFESDNAFPVLSRHPAPNGGPTLLLDPNAVAILAIKAGVRVAKGAGIIVGTIPQGYKVEFLGRGEEAETFENLGKKYFVFLNAEPGAGVIEISSEKDQNLSSTVFTPILQDTITYLDLASPESRDIFVQVVKSGKTPDPDVAGLTVSVSTHRGIQAITQSQGHAALKGVNIIPGFPVFIDVASKSGSEQSFTYRYELKYKNGYGVYVVNQVTDKNIFKWIRQVPRGISDQSAMILGSVNPRLLNGFKNYYYPKVLPLSEKFGLEPMNFSILWDGQISASDPVEGDKPRFMSVQVPEGIAHVKLINEHNQEIYSNLIPVSPRVINVISE